MNISKNIQSLMSGAVFSAILAMSPVQAEEASHGTHDGGPSAAFGLFIGSTDASHGTDFTIGAEFEFRPVPWIGFGPIGEYTFDANHAHDAQLLLGAVHLHPLEGLRLTGGYGYEFLDSEDEEVWRAGVAYEVEMGPFAVGPTVNVDFINGHKSVVYGLIISKHL